MELVFKIFNLSVLPAWILLTFFPKSKITEKLVFSYYWHIVLAFFYTLFIVYGSLEIKEGGFESLEMLRLSFLNEKILLAAWIHYLVFDLFVGVWIVKDSFQKSYNKWLIAPMLLFTLMLGPVGLLLYLGFKKFKN